MVIRRVCAWMFVTVSFVCAAASLAGPDANRLLGAGGGEIGVGSARCRGACDCVSASDRTRLARAREAFIEATRGEMAPYEFFPMGGTLDRDIQAGNWVDLDPGAGSLIWDCSSFAANGHRGVDVELRSFAEQVIGVPVFAVADGVVSFTHDGEPDMNTQLLGQTSNLVAINHGGVRETLYYHLKNGSVAVSVGEIVRAGQQIGLTASSGNSGGPHLHFETIDLSSGSVIEPWSGPCRPGASGWLHQPEYDQTLGLRDFGVTKENLALIPGFPFAVPAAGHLALSEQPHWIWITVANMPTNSTWFIRWVRPDGSLDFQSSTFPFGNTEFFRRSWWWFNWYIFGMTEVPGTWRIQVFINNQQMVDAPIEVLPALQPGFNRAPAPITLRVEPALPKASNAIFCRVMHSLTLDDPDFDVVRYTYDWKVDGVSVRHVTSAGLADAIPRDTALPGQVVTCTVTASDGALSAAPVTATVMTAPPFCAGDANFDAQVDFSDITSTLSNWQADYRPGAGFGDANGDGMVSFADITATLSNWQGGCR